MEREVKQFFVLLSALAVVGLLIAIAISMSGTSPFAN